MLRRNSELNKPTPYFIQGLTYAKALLVGLKKEKQGNLQLSPIPQKMTKYSTDPIIEENNNVNVSEYSPKKKPKPFKQTLRDKQKSINSLGIELQRVNKDIETYQIAFDHLADHYSRVQSVILKHNKAKRENLKLSEEIKQYQKDIEKLGVEIDQIRKLEKKAEGEVAKVCEGYLREVISYNKTQYKFEYPKVGEIGEMIVESDEDAEEQGEYADLSLKYKMLIKQKPDPKKKAAQEPKKIQRGISFEEEIDVVSRYYESEFNDL